jgi:hypothetical protein
MFVEVTLVGDPGKEYAATKNKLMASVLRLNGGTDSDRSVVFIVKPVR